MKTDDPISYYTPAQIKRLLKSRMDAALRELRWGKIARPDDPPEVAKARRVVDSHDRKVDRSIKRKRDTRQNKADRYSREITDLMLNKAPVKKVLSKIEAVEREAAKK